MGVQMALRRPERPVKAGGLSSADAARERMKQSRERMQARNELRRRERRLGELDSLAPGEDDVETVEGMDGLNAAVAKVDKAKRKNKLSGEELEKWQKNRARVKEIRERQADASYYCVLVFDTGGQCNAFINNLMARHVVGRDGDMFLDGRHVAEVFGIPLPPPEYTMTTSVALSKGKAKEMAKVPKGFKA